MKQKLKTNKGITLIALIVTIIILLILATVSVKLIVDNGIVGRSKNATSKYKVAEEKEKINLAYSDYKMAKAENGTATLTVEGATVSGDETSGWTITFAKTGNRYKFVPSQGQPELKPKTEDEEFLEKYILGEDKKGIDLITILNPENWIFTDSSVECLTIDQSYDSPETYVYIKYKEKGYKAVVEVEYDEETDTDEVYRTQSVELVYEPKGMEGQTIPYSYDGTKENEKNWIILYDYGDGVVEIISPDAIGMLELGYGDETAQNPGDIDKNGEANTNLDKAIYSYNNAVSRINKYVSNLVKNSNKISVRSVGSNPRNPQTENNEMYSSDKLTEYNSDYNGIGKKSDNNYEQDVIRMIYHGVKVSSNSEIYWLASRGVYETGDAISFGINDIYFNGGCSRRSLWNVVNIGQPINNVIGECISYAVRPVVKISSDSIKQ